MREKGMMMGAAPHIGSGGSQSFSVDEEQPGEGAEGHRRRLMIVVSPHGGYYPRDVTVVLAIYLNPNWGLRK
jgi:hypothetical protein